MSYPVIANPVTKERGIVRRAPDSDRAPLVADLYAHPGAAVAGEHVHPHSTEAFTVVRGTIDFRLDGVERRAEPGTRIVIPPGTPHYWWNAGDDTAWVILEVDPGRRFEAMIRNLFGLARDGRTDRNGRPSILQAALLAREFDDTIRFTNPPRALQRPLFAALAPFARLSGLRGSYPGYLGDTGETVDHLEQLPPEIEALIPSLAASLEPHQTHPRTTTSHDNHPVRHPSVGRSPNAGVTDRDEARPALAPTAPAHGSGNCRQIPSRVDDSDRRGRAMSTGPPATGRSEATLNQVQPDWQLRTPTAQHAQTVARWSRSADEAGRWVSVAVHPLPASAVAMWWQRLDVQPWLFLDPQGVPVGYGEIWDDPDEDEVELARLIVDPERRRQGVGRLLVAQLLTRARSSGRADCFLRVAPDNTAALALYRSAGFSDVDPAQADAWNQQQPLNYLWLHYLLRAN